MLDGSQESVRLVATLLKGNPDALYTFDRASDDGCFDTALSLKPNLLKLTLTTLVDGTLEAETSNGGKSRQHSSTEH